MTYENKYLKFDDILNDQRKIIYNNRKEILMPTNDQSEIVQDMINDFTVDEIITRMPFLQKNIVMNGIIN